MNEYEQKIEARKQRLLGRAAKLRAAAQAAHDRGHNMAQAIPFGQPILIGHHSEKRDRNYRERITKAFERAAGLCKMAEAADLRAMGVGGAGISSDDPAAVVKLREQLAEMLADQAMRKGMNAAWRAAGRPGPAPENLEKWKAIAAKCGFPEADLEAKFRRMVSARDWTPFPAYSLTNLGANIKRVQQRIVQLVARPTETVEQQIGEVRMVEDADENRVMLFFPGKPPEKVRADLRSSGFKWSPTRGAWVRMLNNAARYEGKRIAQAAA